MYSYIKGEITEITRNTVTVENNGIGFLINIPESSTKEMKIGEERKIYTHYYVTQENISLYGFIKMEDKSMFQTLISISKIGAKSAVAILSSISSEEFAIAVISEDITRLSKLPGIGKKTAQRIVLEIKDKLSEMISTDIEIDKDIKAVEISNEKLEDVKEALLILGYTNKQIVEVLQKLNTESSTEDMIKEALKSLM